MFKCRQLSQLLFSYICDSPLRPRLDLKNKVKFNCMKDCSFLCSFTQNTKRVVGGWSIDNFFNQHSFRKRFFNTVSSLNNQQFETLLQNINVNVIQSKFSESDIKAVLSLLEEKEKIEDNLKQLRSMRESEGNTKVEKEMMELIEEDISKYIADLKEVFNKIIDCLIPKDQFEDHNDIVLEISAGVGGTEAMLFAKDLCNMYCSFLDYKGWEYYVAENDGSELGGVRHCSLLVSGTGAYYWLRHEAGVHRVQRVPVTERSGRVHTSTVSVAVLPQPSDVEVNIKESDLKIETKRASGAGGQHVNTTDSAVRITHIPTGYVVECQTGRSQHHNKAAALKRLKAKIYETELNQVNSSIRTQRKTQVGTGSRSEKIRTYNYKDDRLSDHRLTTNVYNMKEFLGDGVSLDKLLIQLDTWYHNQQVQNVINSLPS